MRALVAARVNRSAEPFHGSGRMVGSDDCTLLRAGGTTSRAGWQNSRGPLASRPVSVRPVTHRSAGLGDPAIRCSRREARRTVQTNALTGLPGRPKTNDGEFERPTSNVEL